MMSYNEIKELGNHLDIFIIDGVLKDTDYMIETINNYYRILHTEGNILKDIVNQYVEDHDSGFLYKKTVYDKY